MLKVKTLAVVSFLMMVYLLAESEDWRLTATAVLVVGVAALVALEALVALSILNLVAVLETPQ
jgi:hypothetical protein